MAKLSPDQLDTALAAAPAWRRKNDAIVRTFEFEDFAQAMMFVNEVARVAERANHHPDIDIRWNKVTLVLSTHDQGGLTSKDFKLAGEIDKLEEGSQRC